MRLSVIIPAHNGGDSLGRCLAALAASRLTPDEVIVVDDGSDDGTADLARARGARVLPLAGGPRGPAVARNEGAAAAEGEILIFLDADVAVRPDAVERLVSQLYEQPQVAAVFGSYDDTPAAPGLASRYRNLLHHYVHQHARREATTFWSGFGAIRRDVFLALGGYSRSYAEPSIEDIELGARLRQAGYRVCLCPEAQVTHLKRWTFLGLISTDIRNRAIPWTRLIVREGRLPADLNLSMGARLSAIAAWVGVLCLGLGLWRPWAWAGALLAAAALGTLNADLYRFFARHGGPGFGALCAALHALYLLYSSLIFVLIAGPAWLARHGLAILLLATLVKGLAWSIVIPPLYGPDEAVHFLYAQQIERFGNWRFHLGQRGSYIPLEAELLSQWVQLKQVRGTGHTLDLADRAGLAAGLARLSDPAVKRAYQQGKAPQILTSHPPLYYAGAAAVQAPLEWASIRVRLLASRWFSVVLAVIAAGLAYGVGRELWPRRPGWALALAMMATFQPMATFVSSVVSNEAMEIALCSACTLVVLRALGRGLTWRRATLLGLLAGLGLLTKISFLSVLPLLGLLFLWHVAQRWHLGRAGWRGLSVWLPVLFLPALIAGWWYKDALLSGGSAMVSTFGTVSRRRHVWLLRYLWRYPWISRYRGVLAAYWGNFGQLDVPLPSRLTASGLWVTGLGALGLLGGLARSVASRSLKRMAGRAFTFLLLACATLGFVAFYTYLDYRMRRDLGGSFGIQARYFLPPIAAGMALLLLGLAQFLPGRLRSRWVWPLPVAMIVLNLYSLYGAIATRYYGPGSLPALIERATVLQPVNAATLWALSALLAGLSVVLGLALGGQLGAHDVEALPFHG